MSSEVPRPEVYPEVIRFTNVVPGVKQTAVFFVRNTGGPYSKVLIGRPPPWVSVVETVPLQRGKKLPMRVRIEAVGSQWESTYSSHITVGLDEARAIVVVELHTQAIPTSAVQTGYERSATHVQQSHPSTSQPTRTRRWLLRFVPILGILFVGLVVYLILAAMTGYTPLDWFRQHQLVSHLEAIADSVNDGYIPDVYDCSDMSIAFWEKAKAEGYEVQIMVGNTDYEINYISEANHAWCMVWLEEEIGSGWLAIDVTAAKAVFAEPAPWYAPAPFTHVDPLYYRGISFDNPSEFRQSGFR